MIDPISILGVNVIVVADNDADVAPGTVPPGILEVLGPNMSLMSNDNMRMYVRRTQWENMKASFKTTK